MRCAIRLTPILAGCCLVCLSGCGGPSTPTAAVNSITVTGTAPLFGATSQFAAAASLVDGTIRDITPFATWSSSNTQCATVSPSGLVTGLQVCQVTITAAFQGVSGSALIGIFKTGPPGVLLPAGSIVYVRTANQGSSLAPLLISIGMHVDAT